MQRGVPPEDCTPIRRSFLCTEMLKKKWLKMRITIRQHGLKAIASVSNPEFLSSWMWSCTFMLLCQYFHCGSFSAFVPLWTPTIISMDWSLLKLCRLCQRSPTPGRWTSMGPRRCYQKKIKKTTYILPLLIDTRVFVVFLLSFLVLFYLSVIICCYLLLQHLDPSSCSSP